MTIGLRVRGLATAIAARPRLTAFLAAVSISFSGVLYLYSDTSPETASFFRGLYGLPILFLAAFAERKTARPMNRKAVGWAIVAGVLFAGDLIFWHHTIEYVGAGLATVLGNLQVVIVGLATWLLFGERLNRRTLIALPIMLVGVALIAGVLTGEAYGIDPPLGVFLGILTAFSYAGYLIVIRRIGRGRLALPVAISTTSTTIVSLAVGVAIGTMQFGIALDQHFWLVLLGVSAQALGYLFISYSLPRLPAVVTSIILLTQPVIAVFLSIILVNETPSVEQLGGVALVIGGIALATVTVRRPFRRSVAVTAP
ncbi:MAG TPA: DMT family transporter [Candidatus Limnocylindrales bacterium]|nr:DMT family transporter [Candidatus Limnocylindrales bacterium]